MPERPQGVAPEFEQLDAERNADDGDAHQQSHGKIDEGDDEAAEDEPEDVSEKIHSAC